MFDNNDPYGLWNGNNPYDGEWRDLHTGVDVATDPFWVDGALDQPGDPGRPIDTRLEGPWGLPWYEGVEDPYVKTPVTISPDPLPWSPNQDIGGEPMKGAYRGEYRTRGPVYQWGHEVSGGLWGDQSIGRIMRFPANIPERFDPYGVFNTDVRDDLAGAMSSNDLPYHDDSTMTSDLLQWPNVWGRV